MEKGVGSLETPTPVTHRPCSPSRSGGSSLGLGCIRVKGSSTATSLKQRPRPREPRAQSLVVRLRALSVGGRGRVSWSEEVALGGEVGNPASDPGSLRGIPGLPRAGRRHGGGRSVAQDGVCLLVPGGSRGGRGGLPTSNPHRHLDTAFPNVLVGAPLTLTPSHLPTSPGGSTERAQVALAPAVWMMHS